MFGRRYSNARVPSVNFSSFALARALESAGRAQTGLPRLQHRLAIRGSPRGLGAILGRGLPARLASSDGRADHWPRTNYRHPRTKTFAGGRGSTPARKL